MTKLKNPRAEHGLKMSSNQGPWSELNLRGKTGGVILVQCRPGKVGGRVMNHLLQGAIVSHPATRYLRSMRTRFFLFPVQRSQSPVFGSGLLHKETKRLLKWFVICPDMCLDTYLRHTCCAARCQTFQNILLMFR